MARPVDPQQAHDDRVSVVAYLDENGPTYPSHLWPAVPGIGWSRRRVDRAEAALDALLELGEVVHTPDGSIVAADSPAVL